MRALLLAAGRGERMRPLTDTTAKPLLPVAGRPLIEWQIDALVRAGICDIVINTAHLAGQMEEALGDGTRLGARIAWSREGSCAQDALETLGGIVRALPLLGEEPFVVASGDILTDFDYATLREPAQQIAADRADAFLVLVDNPPYHPGGDMGLALRRADGREQGWATRQAPLYTYGNIAVLAPRIFAGRAAVREKLFPWLFGFVERGRVQARHWQGRWFNVGTPQDLAHVDRIWQ